MDDVEGAGSGRQPLGDVAQIHVEAALHVVEARADACVHERLYLDPVVVGRDEHLRARKPQPLRGVPDGAAAQIEELRARVIEREGRPGSGSSQEHRGGDRGERDDGVMHPLDRRRRRRPLAESGAHGSSVRVMRPWIARQRPAIAGCTCARTRRAIRARSVGRQTISVACGCTSGVQSRFHGMLKPRNSNAANRSEMQRWSISAMRSCPGEHSRKVSSKAHFGSQQRPPETKANWNAMRRSPSTRKARRSCFLRARSRAQEE